jgi:hypothetical protein
MFAVYCSIKAGHAPFNCCETIFEQTYLEARFRRQSVLSRILVKPHIVHWPAKKLFVSLGTSTSTQAVRPSQKEVDCQVDLCQRHSNGDNSVLS